MELTNTAKNYEAAILDVRNDELLSKAEMVEDLPARLKEVEGAAVIVLLDKVEGDLTFNATTVMDLNGQTIEGNITSNKNLIIVDSSLNNDNAGGVTGTISGTATIIGGYYKDASVEAFVKDGYELKQTANGYQVQNVLYTLSTGANGDLAFDINSDILEENIDRYTVFAAELAADVAVDLVANYYTAAALSVEVLNDRNQDDNFAPGWKKIYDFSFTDFVDLVESDSIPTDLLNMGLKMVSLPDLACVINMITADLLDLNAIQSALKNNQAIASYGFQIAPWMIEIEHKTEEDYLTFGLTTNEDNAKSIHISLFISGENYTDEMAEVIAYIDRIVVEEDTFFQLVDVEELTYADKHFNLTGGAKGKVHLDLSDYTTAMAILVANGLSDDAEADVDKIVAAVNNGDKDALKVEFDKLTVKDVNRNNSLAELAEKVGITVKVEPNKYLEKALVLSLSAAGKVLERFDITGNDATLGNLDDDGDGIYEFGPKSVSKSGTITKRGYGVNLDLTIAEGAIAINLFNDDCLWGDADHNGEVNAKDASLILAYAVEDITGTFNMDEVNKTNICLKKTDVNGDGKTNAKDASLVLAYVVEDISKFPVEE